MMIALQSCEAVSDFSSGRTGCRRELMPEWLSIHESVLVNTIGHCAGAVVFGMLLYLFLLDWRREREERNDLPIVAASLALLWNLGSLVALAAGPKGGTVADIVVAGSFSVLSLLPAVLLHISLESRHRALWVSGYVLSFVAVALHVSELLTRAPRLHNAALLLVTLGFTALTVISVFLELRHRNHAAGSRLAGAMGLTSAPSMRAGPGRRSLPSIMPACPWPCWCCCRTIVSCCSMPSCASS
jgi:hypothetical protein